MEEVSCHIKRLVGERGVYGAVSIQLEYSQDQNDDELIFQSNDGVEWHSAVKFAFSYFLEKYFRRENRLRVIVTSIHGQAIDTSSILIVYLMLQCMRKATGFDPGVIFNESNAVIEFRH